MERQLNPEREAAIEQLSLITAIKDHDLLYSVLNEHNWDISASVNLLTHPQTNDMPQIHTSSTRYDSSTLTHRSSNPVLPPPQSQTPQTSHPKLLTLWDYLSLPITTSFKIAWSLFSYITKFFTKSSSAFRKDNRSVAATFLLDFDQQFGTGHPHFFQGSYSNALDVAKKELKYLLVYLHSPHHDYTHAFCLNTICNDALINYCSETPIIFWAGSISDSEAFQVSNILGVSAYPFIGLIVPEGAKMVVIDRVEGNTSPQVLIDRLNRHISRLDASLRHQRFEREEREQARQIRDLQDRAYRDSLRADEEKKMATIEELAEKQRLIDSKKSRLEAKHIRVNFIKANPIPEPAAGPNVANVSIRLPNGTRIVRRFLATDTVNSLLEFIETQDTKPIPFSAEIEVVISYPRRVISDLSQTIKDAGLFPNASVIIEEKCFE